LGVGKPPAGTEGADYVLQKPPAEERAAIDAAIEKSLAVLPQIIVGDMQAAMNKLHTEEAKQPESAKQPEIRKEPQAENPAEKPGLLKSLFGRK